MDPAPATSDEGPSRAGLTAAEARRRLAETGPNLVPAARTTSVWRALIGQLVHFFAGLLWVAGILAIIGGLPQLGIAIFAVVIINGLFAFAQEYRAEAAAARLRDLVPRRATVIRDGAPAELDAAELVPGDLVVLAGGDRVSADELVIESHGVQVDESILTGESEPVTVEAGGRLQAGTFLVQGEGLAVVQSTGAATTLGQLATLTGNLTRPPTPLALELNRLVRTVALVALSVGVLFFGVVLALHTSLAEGFVFAVGVTVALVPEGLLPTVTLSLAVGAQRMARRDGLVRRLESVETLGSTTFICTDKTGTLTQNRMNVAEMWLPGGRASIEGLGYRPEAEVSLSPAAGFDAEGLAVAVRAAAVAARRCSVGSAVERDGDWEAQGDPMEAAIDALARRVGADVEGATATEPDQARNAFDPARRRMSVVTAANQVLVKGAPDAVLPRCRDLPPEAAAALDELSGRGLRVLAVAHRVLDGPSADTSADTVERDLDLMALLGILDPPRPGMADALARCREAGIRVAMITGDHPATAAAIADQIGLRLASSPLLTGAELPHDEQLLAATVDRDGAVIARVTPEDKLRVARALRSRGHVVAMTGDGVNDGPALREADIGIAMGRSGTDVAREAADLVLLDDEFATIVEAVRLGRVTFRNTRQFLAYHLTDNVAELAPFLVWALSGGRFPLALGVLQILALDLGTDTLSAAALGAEPPESDDLGPDPASGRLLNAQVAERAFGLLGPTEAVWSLAAFVVSLAAAGWRPGQAFPTGAVLASASGATFITVVLAQAVNVYASRSPQRPAWRIDPRTNPFLLVAVAVGFGFALALLAVPAAADLLDQRWPSAAGWAMAVAVMPVMVGVDAAGKAGLRRRPKAQVRP
ncbi:MAG: cation-transporting P-type ATPase [Acidimicrobiales bacterium]